MQVTQKNILYLLFILAALAACSTAQTSATQDDEDPQSWNDVQLTVPMSKQVDVFARLTMRFGQSASQLSEGRFGGGYVWKPVKSFSISPFYFFIKTRNTAGRLVNENRLNLAATYHFPFKSFGLSHRSTYESRIRAPANSWRYRAMLTVDKDLPESVLRKTKWFVADEAFYDSRTEKFSRNRFSVGITKEISKELTLDLYYTRQNDGFSHPGDLNILGSTWKIRL